MTSRAPGTKSPDRSGEISEASGGLVVGVFLAAVQIQDNDAQLFCAELDRRIEEAFIPMSNGCRVTTTSPSHETRLPGGGEGGNPQVRRLRHLADARRIRKNSPAS